MQKNVNETVEKLSKFYDLDKPEDLFTVLPQEMEIAEIKGVCNELTGEQKKELVMEVFSKLIKKQKCDINPELISIFIDIICNATNGKYALNKKGIFDE